VNDKNESGREKTKSGFWNILCKIILAVLLAPFIAIGTMVIIFIVSILLYALCIYSIEEARANAILEREKLRAKREIEQEKLKAEQLEKKRASEERRQLYLISRRNKGIDVCMDCETESPDRCSNGHCLKCAGQCIYCYCCLDCRTKMFSDTCATCYHLFYD